ncbi:MAG: hypothetical protein AAF681_13965, partial [Pseudomonadota bacterium]
MTEATVSFGNTALPLAILALLAAVLPYMLSPRDTRSHARVVVGIGLTALLMMVVSGVVFALIDTRDLPNGGATGVMIIAWFYLRSAFGAAAIWGPVLAIVWLSLAQRVEKRRGED